MSALRHPGLWPLLLVSALSPSRAWAQPTPEAQPDAEAEASAAPTEVAPPAEAPQTDEEPGAEGLAAYRAGDFGRALELLAADYRRAPLPSLGLWTARTLVKLERLLEAEKRYGEVAQIDEAAVRPSFAALRPQAPTAAELDAQKKAIEDAAEEGRQLAAKIPSIRMRVERAPAGDLSVTLDGAALPLSDLEAPRRLDPGNYRIEARVGETAVIRAVQLTVAENPLVVLTFPPPRMLVAAEEDPESAQRIVGWIGVGVGIGGIGVGAVLAGIAGARLADLDCPADTCAADQAGDVDAYNNLRMASGISMIAGGLLTATGIALIATAPRGPDSGAWIAPALGPAGIGLRGSF